MRQVDCRRQENSCSLIALRSVGKIDSRKLYVLELLFYVEGVKYSFK